MEKGKFSSELAIKMYYENKNLENKAKGIIYYGSSDGYCLVKYPPVEDGTITMLGYANDVPTNDLVKMQETRGEQIDDLYLPVEGDPIYFGFNI